MALNLKQPPPPQQVHQRLKKAIKNGENPANLIYEILKGEDLASGYLRSGIVKYKEALLLLTSPEGRQYIRDHLENLLDYIQQEAIELSMKPLTCPNCGTTDKQKFIGYDIQSQVFILQCKQCQARLLLTEQQLKEILE